MVCRTVYRTFCHTIQWWHDHQKDACRWMKSIYNHSLVSWPTSVLWGDTPWLLSGSLRRGTVLRDGMKCFGPSLVTWWTDIESCPWTAVGEEERRGEEGEEGEEKGGEERSEGEGRRSMTRVKREQDRRDKEKWVRWGDSNREKVREREVEKQSKRERGSSRREESKETMGSRDKRIIIKNREVRKRTIIEW